MPNRNPIQIIDRVIDNVEAVGLTLQDNDGVAIDVTSLTLTVELRLMSDNSKIGDTITAAKISGQEANGKISFTPNANQVDTVRNMAVYVFDDSSPVRIWPYDGARCQFKVKDYGTSD